LGYLPDEDVPVVLAGASALVFPTYYEGFGLPILEAFACGVPVICSNASSLPEVTCGNAIFFDPYKQADVINKLKSYMKETNKHEEFVRRGLKIALKSSWGQSAAQLKELLFIPE